MDSGSADLVSGCSLEGGESLGLARLGIAVAPLSAGCLDLGAPVDVHVEPVVPEELLAASPWWVPAT